MLMRRPEPGGHSITLDMVGLLREWGNDVDIIDLDTATDLTAVRPDHDLYVLRSVTEGTLSHAGILDALGATIVNCYPVTRVCCDKVLVTRLLQLADVPVPETFVAQRPGQLEPLLDDGPIVVKPQGGSRGRGVKVVWDADELLDLAAPDGPVLAQRYHERQGRDRKLYCIGGQLFGVKRVWPARTYAEKLGEPFTVSAELRDIADHTAAAIGTDLFGLDVVISGGRPYVVDVNPFPGFKGVPDAALRLADYIHATASATVAPADTGLKEVVS
jgi:glutathione synthase/RimK-type ligase-like ATP-grasp enzyme